MERACGWIGCLAVLCVGFWCVGLQQKSIMIIQRNSPFVALLRAHFQAKKARHFSQTNIDSLGNYCPFPFSWNFDSCLNNTFRRAHMESSCLPPLAPSKPPNPSSLDTFKSTQNHAHAHAGQHFSSALMQLNHRFHKSLHFHLLLLHAHTTTTAPTTPPHPHLNHSHSHARRPHPRRASPQQNLQGLLMPLQQARCQIHLYLLIGRLAQLRACMDIHSSQALCVSSRHLIRHT